MTTIPVIQNLKFFLFGVGGDRQRYLQAVPQPQEMLQQDAELQ